MQRRLKPHCCPCGQSELWVQPQKWNSWLQMPPAFAQFASVRHATQLPVSVKQ